MNNASREKVVEVVAQLEEVQAMLNNISDQLEAVRNEEQEALDNMPENLRDSVKGCQMQEFIYTLDSVLDEIYNSETDVMLDQLLEFV